ncbi:MAG: hypothetical protein ABSF55_00680 [Candidatus Staskawiczbacteria bacterium]|jgi:hypothetical protein
MDPNKTETRGNKSPETKAEEELLQFGLQVVPENIKAIVDLQKAMQHPAGYGDIVKSDSLEDIGKAMRKRKIKQVIHIEDASLWIHCKLAMKLVEFLPIPEEKKADLKLIMLYHDLGKVGMKDTQEIRHIQRKEIDRGKLYKVAKGHALERPQDIENGFRANGISGRKLEVFMNVVQNHMETSLSEMTGPKLAKLFEGFGKTDDERKEVAELLALAIQVDGNACMQVAFNESGELQNPKKENRTGADFDKIWAKYLEAKEK